MFGFISESNELLWASYERKLRLKPASDLTIKAYEETLAQVEEFLDGMDLLDVQKPDLEDYFGYLLETLALTTAASRFRNLRAFYNWAVKEEIIDKSPMRAMSEPSAPEPVVTFPPDEDIRALLADCKVSRGQSFHEQFMGRRDEAIIRVFCEPGSPRVTESAKLEIDQLDMRRSRIMLHGKGRKVREIVFGARTGTALDRYLRLRSKHHLAHLPRLWLGRQGQEISGSGIRQMIARRCSSADIPHIHPHLLRHASAHNWKANGGSEEDMMYLFGWSSPAMARRYGKSAQKERAQRSSQTLSPADRF